MSDSFATRLNDAIRRTQSITCVGLDPRKANLPGELKSLAESDHPDAWAAAYTAFCKGVIDSVADLVPCVKPQVAFFEQLGPAGSVALGEVIAFARDAGLMVIVDAKRNDIGSTASAYADAYLGSGKGDQGSSWGGDSLTVSPYLGRDSLDPFVEVCDQRSAGIFVLVKTSNPGGGDFQDRLSDGNTLYEDVADMVTDINESRLDDHGYGPVGAVVGATYPEQLAALRKRMPHSILLVPGFGAQGGKAEHVRHAKDAEGMGAVVNSSRGIIFAYQQDDYRTRFGEQGWKDAIRAATIDMNAALA